MLGYGGWIAFSNILSPIQENTERLLLAGLLPINLLTYYSVPKEITDRISIIPGSLISALFPVISSIDISEREKLVQVFNQSFKAICFSVGLILVLLVCLSEVALTVWINEEFSLRSSAVLKIFSFGVLASSLSGLTMIVFQGLGRPDITAKQQLIRFPIILAMAWFMITEYGLVGAAGAWTLGRSLALFMNMIALKVLLNISYLKIIQVESIISLAVFPLAYSFYYSTINLLGTNSIALNFMLLVICLLIFLGIHWMCVFSRDDRVWVSRLLNLKN
jgi:O-antigen/teichoic acid export membrane protein